MGGGDAGDDARHAEPLREQERAVGDDGRERDLDEVVVEAAVDQRRAVAHGEADREPPAAIHRNAPTAQPA